MKKPITEHIETSTCTQTILNISYSHLTSSKSKFASTGKSQIMSRTLIILNPITSVYQILLTPQKYLILLPNPKRRKPIMDSQRTQEQNTMHASQNLAKIRGGSGQYTNPYARHCQNPHCIFRIRVIYGFPSV